MIAKRGCFLGCTCSMATWFKPRGSYQVNRNMLPNFVGYLRHTIPRMNPPQASARLYTDSSPPERRTCHCACTVIVVPSG